MEIGAGTVHVWRIPIDGSRPTETERATLSQEERDRSSRYVNELDRVRYEVSHVALRSILAAYLSASPGELPLISSTRGKPGLAGSAIRFNMSHAGAFALVALARDREVGVDVEAHIPFDVETVARRMFSPSEIEAISRVPKAERLASFYDCWTCKEAVVKAIGRGIWMPFQDFDVSWGTKAALLACRSECRQVETWGLEQVPVAPGYSAAVAFEGRGLAVSSFEWPGDARCRTGQIGSASHEGVFPS